MVLVAVAASTAAPARLREHQVDLPVAVVNAYGKAVSQSITLTIFFNDATPAPRPLIVLNHGRAVEAADRAALGRVRLNDASRWFAGLGFAVAVPTRLGYGVSGGEDVEDSGECPRKNYPPAYAAAAQQTLAVLEYMQAQPDVSKARGVVLGQSFGGTTSIAVAGLNPPGVVATINFAGGGGGNPNTRPGAPCAPHLLENLFADYGKTARLPTLWIYTENDRYMGPRYPRQWFDAFKAAGGVGEFVQLPPHGQDGHLLFSRFPASWHPLVAEFLRQHGFDLKEAP
ncbi:MAG: dienelactone hydrolase family protein [Rhizobacter sp.]